MKPSIKTALIVAGVAGVGLLIGASVAAAQAATESNARTPALPPAPTPATSTGSSSTSKPPKPATSLRSTPAAPPAPKPPAQLPPSPVLLRAGTWLAGVFRSAGATVAANPQQFAGTAVDPNRPQGTLAGAWDRLKSWFSGPLPPGDDVGVNTLPATSLRSSGGKK